MAKTLIWKDLITGEIPVSFCTSTYLNNGNLYVGLETVIEGFAEHWCDVTVNTDDVCDSDCGFIDTNNNPDIDSWLIENGIAVPTGNWAVSGFCMFPEFRFNMERVLEYGRKMK